MTATDRNRRSDADGWEPETVPELVMVPATPPPATAPAQPATPGQALRWAAGRIVDTSDIDPHRASALRLQNIGKRLSEWAAELDAAPAVPRTVLAEIAAERQRQDAKWGQQNHPDGTIDQPADRRLADMARRTCQAAAEMGTVTWRDILSEEMHEAFAEHDPAKLRAELVQIAAVVVAWVEAIDRRGPLSTAPPAGATTLSCGNCGYTAAAHPGDGPASEPAGGGEADDDA